MYKYQCSSCKKVEYRSTDQWEIECSCENGKLTTLPTGDYNLCQVCGKFLPSNKHICSCGNHQLIHWTADEPLVNATIIREILQCVAEDTRTHFECKYCKSSFDIYRTTAVNAFCSCGELMEQPVADLKAFRESKRWNQRIMSAELNVSERYYRKLELKQCTPSPKVLTRIIEIMSIKG